MIEQLELHFFWFQNKTILDKSSENYRDFTLLFYKNEALEMRKNSFI